MLLGRLATNATRSSQAEVTEMSGVRWTWLSARALPNVYRVMACAAVVGSIVGMVVDDVAGAYAVQVARLYDQAAAACDAAGNNTNLSLDLSDDINAIRTKAGTADSVQSKHRGTDAAARVLRLPCHCVVEFGSDSCIAA